MYEAIMKDPTIEKKDKLMYVEMIRASIQEKGCYPPKGAASSETIHQQNINT